MLIGAEPNGPGKTRERERAIGGAAERGGLMQIEISGSGGGRPHVNLL